MIVKPQQIANDKRIARNLTSVFPHPYTIDDARSFLGTTREDLASESKAAIGDLDPGLIGVLGSSKLSGESEGVYLFGYWLAVEAWGHGFATEASRAYLDHLIATEKPRRIEAGVYAWNAASCNVLEKLGFELEGRMRSKIRRFDEVTDELMYALLP